MRTNRKELIIRTAITGFLLLSVVFLGTASLAQRDYNQYTRGQTRSQPDDTYGKGGTKEETPFSAKDGATVSKEDVNFKQTIWKDKAGRVRHVSDGRME